MKFDNKKAVILLIVLVGGYYLLSKLKPRDNLYYAKIIVSSGNSGVVENIVGFDRDFLRLWAEGIKAGKEVFYYNGKAYNTDGGTAVR
jgi:hypothetical protein